MVTMESQSMLQYVLEQEAISGYDVMAKKKKKCTVLPKWSFNIPVCQAANWSGDH